MAVSLAVNEQQAALLMPILRQLMCSGELGGVKVAECTAPTSILSHSRPQSDEFETTRTSAVTNECSYKPYSSFELLNKKKKNTKSNEAQSVMHVRVVTNQLATKLYTIREAAKLAGFWDKAPYLSEISPQAMEAFYESVFKNCTQLTNERQAVRKRLSDALTNRRAHLIRSQLVEKRKPNNIPKPTATTIAPTPIIAPVAPVVHKLKKPDKSSRKSLLGTRVEVIFRDQPIGEGILVSIDEKSMFSSVVLKDFEEISEEINLYKPLGDKYYFNQLKKSDVFEWKSEKLLVKGMQMTVADALLSNTNIEELKSKQIKHKDKTVKTPAEKSPSDNPDWPPLSQYELQRLERIKNNKTQFEKIIKKKKKDSPSGASTHKKIACTSKSKEKPTTAATTKQPTKRQQKSETSTFQKSVKRPKYWEMVSDDEENDCDIFKQTVVTGKRQRKPPKKLFN